MVIAGIDGSSTKTGIAIHTEDGYKTHTLIDLHKIKDSDVRLPQMMCEICNYLDGFKIDKIIMEKSVLKSNVATVQLLSMLSGAVMLYAAQHGIEFENPVPSVWRKRCGLEQSKNVKRDVLKAEAIKAVEQEYGLTVTDDEAESLLMARSGFDLPKINIHAEDVIDDIGIWGEM